MRSCVGLCQFIYFSFDFRGVFRSDVIMNLARMIVMEKEDGRMILTIEILCCWFGFW